MLTLTQLKEICERLNKAQVQYIVIGGFAVILHGFERVTRDIDLLVESSSDNIQKLKVALKDLLPEACSELEVDDVHKNVVVRMVGEELIVDLMEHVGEIDYSKVKIIEEEVGSVKIPIADLESLIELKKGLRDKDQRDFLFLKGKQEFLKRQKEGEK